MAGGAGGHLPCPISPCLRAATGSFHLCARERIYTGLQTAIARAVRPVRRGNLIIESLNPMVHGNLRSFPYVSSAFRDYSREYFTLELTKVLEPTYTALRRVNLQK
jgi:hypothetical protein